MSLRVGDVYKSDFMKAMEFPEGGLNLTIKGARGWKSPDGRDTIALSFLETEQELIINRTNGADLAKMSNGNDDAESWTGMKIHLSSQRLPKPFQGNTHTFVVGRPSAMGAMNAAGANRNAIEAARKEAFLALKAKHPQASQDELKKLWLDAVAGTGKVQTAMTLQDWQELKAGFEGYGGEDIPGNESGPGIPADEVPFAPNMM